MFNRLKGLLFVLIKTDYIYLLLLSLLTKGFLTSFSFEDVAVCLGLAALSGFKSYLTSKQPVRIEMSPELRVELDNLKGALNALKMERGFQNQPVKQRFF